MFDALICINNHIFFMYNLHVINLAEENERLIERERETDTRDEDGCSHKTISVATQRFMALIPCRQEKP